MDGQPSINLYPRVYRVFCGWWYTKKNRGPCNKTGAVTSLSTASKLEKTVYKITALT